MKPVRFKNKVEKETDLTSMAVQYLVLQGVYAWRNNSGVARTDGRWIRYGKVGSADVIGVMPGFGRFIGVETKTDENKLSKSQKEFRAELQSRNGIYIVARSIQELDEKYEEAVC